MRLSSVIRALLLAALLLPVATGGTALAQYEIVTEGTSIKLTATADPAIVGRYVLTAALEGQFGQGVADGRVAFYDLSTSRVLGWTGVAHPRITVDGLAPGRHLLRADYTGSNGLLPVIVLPSQSDELALDVLATPIVTLSSSQLQATSGALVTLVVAVTGSHGVPGGTVTFRDGDRVLATHVPLDRTGLVSFATSALDDGLGQVVAVYEGDGRYAPAAARLEPAAATMALVDPPRM